MAECQIYISARSSRSSLRAFALSEGRLTLLTYAPAFLFLSVEDPKQRNVGSIALPKAKRKAMDD